MTIRFFSPLRVGHSMIRVDFQGEMQAFSRKSQIYNAACVIARPSRMPEREKKHTQTHTDTHKHTNTHYGSMYSTAPMHTSPRLVSNIRRMPTLKLFSRKQNGTRFFGEPNTQLRKADGESSLLNGRGHPRPFRAEALCIWVT